MQIRSPALIAMAGVLLAVPSALSAGSNDALGHAAMVRGDGTSAGTAKIALRRGKPVLELNLSGLTPGVHGAHIHAVGQCGGSGAAFTGAGPHLNPQHRKHGMNNPEGHHLGDLPNITVDSRGRARLRLELGLNPGQLATELYDADGSALVIHAGPDDYVTDPAGNSGARVACGVLVRG